MNGFFVLALFYILGCVVSWIFAPVWVVLLLSAPLILWSLAAVIMGTMWLVQEFKYFSR